MSNLLCQSTDMLPLYLYLAILNIKNVNVLMRTNGELCIQSLGGLVYCTESKKYTTPFMPPTPQAFR